MPDGTFSRFRVVESPIMEPNLAVKFPQLKTYFGQGVDDATATVRLDLSPAGLNARIISSEGAISIASLSDVEPGLHASYPAGDVPSRAGELQCADESVSPEPSPAPAEAATPFLGASPAAAGGEVMLRTYRLAVAAMGEFTAAHGGTVESAVAAVVTVVNQVNGIFERDFAIRLVLVASNNLVIYTNAATDPYTPTRDIPSLNATIAVNQGILDTIIGPANYDVGYLFGRGESAGNTLNGVVCVNGSKAAAASTLPAALDGTDWFVRVTAHELGHLFGANHTYNGINSLCNTRAAVAAFEPGSGSTLMSYVTVCGAADNLQARQDSYFHSGNIDEVRAYVTTGNGRNCGAAVLTGNHAPTVSAGPNFTIPKGTPFTLTATGRDDDGDSLTFCWEERDLGPAQAASGPGSADNGASPLFRSFAPTNNPARTFPKLADILDNVVTIGERLPTTSRTMRFRITARDNRAGVAGSDMQVTVTSNAGPFLVTGPNAGVVWSGTQTVTWDVAGTTNPPVLATNVNILLSTNDGLSFPFALATNTPNDGSETVFLPEVFSRNARIKVEAAGNIFFDLSNTNFTVVPSAPVFVAAGTTLLVEGCSPANGAMDPGETVTAGFVLQNLGAAPATNVTLTLVAEGGVLSPGAPQTIGTVPANGGRVTNGFTFTVDPSLSCGEALRAVLRLNEGGLPLGDVAFPLPLGQTVHRTNRLANPAPIIITTNLLAQPYPSVIPVSNLAGTVSHISVTLSNLTHLFLRDLKIVLVGPQGQSVMLLSDVPLDAVSNLRITFDDRAIRPLIAVTQVVSGVYRPTNGRLLQPDVLPPPAPPGPYGEALSTFVGSNPNGPWRLLVIDTWPVDGGSLTGWNIEVTTSNTVCCSPMGMALNVVDSADPVTVGSNLTYHITVTNVAETTATEVLLTNRLAPGVTFIAATPSQGACTFGDGVVACAPGGIAAGTSATVTVTVRADAPGTATNIVNVTRQNLSSPDDGITVTELTTVTLPPVSVSIADASLREGNVGLAPMNFTVRLSSPADAPMTVDYATSNGTATAGSDFAPQGGQLTFGFGSMETNIVVTVAGDTLLEGAEAFSVTLFNPTNVLLGAKSQAVGTILNDDGLPGVVDHFAWSGIESTQYVGLLFPATVTARDAAEAQVSSFQGPVFLTAYGTNQETVIGTNSGTFLFPMAANFHDARLQSVYLASELGRAARLTALALHVVTPPGGLLSNWTIRLKHTGLTNQSPSVWEAIGWATVFQTNLSLMSTGWVNFPFNAPFDYDGARHLLVDFTFNNASSSTAGLCRYTQRAANRSIYSQVNSTFGDPLAWSGTNSPTPGSSGRVPDVRLTAQPAEPLLPGASGAFVDGVWRGDLFVPQFTGQLTLSATDGDGHYGFSEFLRTEAPVDTDADGLPDPWELRYFGGLDAPDSRPLDDFDHDGASNRDELSAGTDPTDGASTLRCGSSFAMWTRG